MYIENGADKIDTYMFKIFQILYADDIEIFANSRAAV